jgi:hypothetical protein
MNMKVQRGMFEITPHTLLKAKSAGDCTDRGGFPRWKITGSKVIERSAHAQ